MKNNTKKKRNYNSKIFKNKFLKKLINKSKNKKSQNGGKNKNSLNKIKKTIWLKEYKNPTCPKFLTEEEYWHWDYILKKNENI